MKFSQPTFIIASKVAIAALSLAPFHGAAAMAYGGDGYSCADLANAQAAYDSAYLARTGFDEGGMLSEIEYTYHACTGSIPATDGPGQDACVMEYQANIDNFNNYLYNLQFELEQAEDFLNSVANNLDGPC